MQENLDTIAEVLSSGIVAAYVDSDQLANKIRKLIDHVHLEEIRTRDVREIGGFKQLAQSISIGVQKQRTELDDANERLDQLEKRAGDMDGEITAQLEKARGLADDIHGQTIAVLGIFSAIVLAFNGGIAFSSSSIAPFVSEDVFIVCFVISIIGIFLFNLLFALLTFVYRMVHQAASLWCILSQRAYITVNLIAFLIVAALGHMAYCCS